MLKIKDNIDLKELEKHLLKLNIMDGDECRYTNVYCCISQDNKKFIENNCIDDYFVNFFINKQNKIDFCTYPEMLNWREVFNGIYDLIKDGLVEKVD